MFTSNIHAKSSGDYDESKVYDYDTCDASCEIWTSKAPFDSHAYKRDLNRMHVPSDCRDAVVTDQSNANQIYRALTSLQSMSDVYTGCYYFTWYRLNSQLHCTDRGKGRYFPPSINSETTHVVRMHGIA
jgi:hypothetical protein